MFQMKQISSTLYVSYSVLNVYLAVLFIETIKVYNYCMLQQNYVYLLFLVYGFSVRDSLNKLSMLVERCCLVDTEAAASVPSSTCFLSFAFAVIFWPVV